MRSAFSKTLLLATLFVLNVVELSFAARTRSSKYCMFDQLMREQGGQLPAALVKQTPKGGRKSLQTQTVSANSGDWQPLRIAVSTKDLEDDKRHCIAATAKREIVDFEGKRHTCRVASTLGGAQSPENVRRNIETTLQKAIKLHTDRLFVKRATGPIQLPEFTAGVCQHFTVPAEYRDPGLDSADMVLFAGAAPNYQSTTTGWAVPCAVDREGRPVAGAVNLFPNAIAISRQTVRGTAHQIAHALGFWHEAMQNLRMTDKLQVRAKRSHVSIVKTKKVKQSVKRHYGCNEAPGMELEDGPDNRDTQSHWERRNAKDELMADFFSDGISAPLVGLYTNLTLSAFEDMGFYKANFAMAEAMKYGRDAGCEFLQESCWTKSRAVRFTDMFCETEGFLSCTTDRRSLGLCIKEPIARAASQWNFADLLNTAKVGQRSALTDFCPVVVPFGLTCKNILAQGKGTAAYKDSLGADVWCLDGDNLKLRLIGNTPVSVGGVCAEVSCESDKTVKVKVEGDGTWRACAENGDITPQSKGTTFVSGSIKCPKYEEVCAVGKEGESLATDEAAERSN